MEIIKGFPSTSQDTYQLNVTNIIKHGARIFGRQEIASRQHDGSMFRYTYKDAYVRMQRLANATERLGLEVVGLDGPVPGHLDDLEHVPQHELAVQLFAE